MKKSAKITALLSSLLVSSCVQFNNFSRKTSQAVSDGFVEVVSLFGASSAHQVKDSNSEQFCWVVGKDSAPSINHDLSTYVLTTNALMFENMVNQAINEEKDPSTIAVFDSFFDAYATNQSLFNLVKQYDSNQDGVVYMWEVKDFLENKKHRELKTKKDLSDLAYEIKNKAVKEYNDWMLINTLLVKLGSSEVKEMTRQTDVLKIASSRNQVAVELEEKASSFLYVYDFEKETLTGYEGGNVNLFSEQLEKLLALPQIYYTEKEKASEYNRAILDLLKYQEDKMR